MQREENEEAQEAVTNILSTVTDQLDELVKLAFDLEKRDLKPGISLQDIALQLVQLKSMIDGLQAAQTNALSNLGISEKELDAMRTDALKQGGPQQKLLNKLGTLQKQCEEGRERMYAAVQENQGAARKVRKQMKAVKTSKKAKTVNRKSRWIKG